ALFLLGVGHEVVEFRDGRGRRLFHQDVLAGIDGFADIGMSDTWGGADRDEVDFRHRAVELGGGLEHRQAVVGYHAGRHGGGDFEIVGAVDHRQVLVDGDLAYADDGDLAL